MVYDIGVVVHRRRQRRLRCRDAFFRDGTNPLEKFDDVELFTKFRFQREYILELTNHLKALLHCSPVLVSVYRSEIPGIEYLDGHNW